MVSRNSFGIGTVVTIVVVALIAGALVPPAINAATGADFSEQSESFGISEGQTYNFTTVNTSATLDNVNGSTTPSEATYTFESGGDSETLTIGEGNNASTTLNGTTYNVSVTQVDAPNDEATAVVTYDTDNGGTAQSIWAIVPLMMVLAVALLFVGFGTNARDNV